MLNLMTYANGQLTLHAFSAILWTILVVKIPQIRQ